MQGWDAAIATGTLGAFWGVLYVRRRSAAAPLVLPATPGPGIPATANQLTLFHIGRFTVVEHEVAGGTTC